MHSRLQSDVTPRSSRRWVRWTLPPLDTKDIRAWLRSKIAGGLNPNDADAMRGAGAELLALLDAAAKVAKPERRTQADALVDLAQGKYRLGMSTDGEAFAVARDGANVALMFRGGGSALRASLAKSYRATTGKTPSASALADALMTLEGIAQDSAPEPVALRLAEIDGGIVLDLADAEGRAAVVNGDGVTVVNVAPVLFRRTALSAPLPEPTTADASALAEFRALLNVDADSWPLVMGWLVAALMPNIPHPVLMLGGEQGTGKSTAARLMLGLVDPSCAPLRSEPRDAEQWAIAASGSWCVALDNVSRISGWLSDALCKAVTGDGLVRRKLYTDSDLAVLSFRRCIIITSIDVGAMRGDLGDRLLIVDLESIADDRRRTENEIEAEYQTMRPRLLGALLSALSRTLAALPDVKLATMPRMADFARVLAALDTACPELTGGRALELFAGQRRRIAGDVVESDAVAAAIVTLIAARESPWNGTSAELLAMLTPAPPAHTPKHWPTSARGMSGHLRRIIPALRVVGIDVTIPATRSSGGRIIQIERVGNRPSQPSQPSLDAAGAAESNIGSDGRAESVTVGDGRVAVEPSLDFNGNGPEIDVSDGCDGSNPVIPDRDADAEIDGTIGADDAEMDRLEREAIQGPGM